MLSSAKYYKDFILVDADSRRALEYISELDRNWTYGPVTANQVGDKVQILFWENDEKKDKETVRKAVKLAEKYNISVRLVTFK